jgi:hypothetical protein
VDTGADSGVGAFAMLAGDDEGGSRFRGRGGEDEEEDEEGEGEEDGGGWGVSAAFPRVASAPLLSRLRGGVAHPRADVAFASFHAFAPAAAASSAAPSSASSSGLAFPPVPELAASAASAPPVPALSAAGPRSVASRSASIEDGGIHF